MRMRATSHVASRLAQVVSESRNGQAAPRLRGQPARESTLAASIASHAIRCERSGHQPTASDVPPCARDQCQKP